MLNRKQIPSVDRSSKLPDRAPAILVADADADTRALYRAAFEDAGFEVAEAADGREALVLALKRPPALLVAELTLPFVDGYALCEILRRDPGTTKMAILIVTAETRAQQAQRVERARANLMLLKPVAIDQIVGECKRLLGRPGGIAPAGETALPCDAGAQSATAAGGFRDRPRTHSKSFVRFSTRTPPRTAEACVCPSCDRTLRYERSQIGGVNARGAEQWDYYRCDSCGATYQYRQRTRKLSCVEDPRS
jgi:two-component system chemotaxis response regulator CheY